jgi:hypothetical protein
MVVCPIITYVTSAANISQLTH